MLIIMDAGPGVADCRMNGGKYDSSESASDCSRAVPIGLQGKAFHLYALAAIKLNHTETRDTN